MDSVKLTTVNTVNCIIILYVLAYHVMAFSKLGGAYDVEIKSIDQCDDPGNGELDFKIKMRKISKYNYSYDVNWTTQVPFDDNVGISVLFVMSKRSFAGWGLNAINYETKTPCATAMLASPELTTSFLSNSGLEPPNCPIKEGSYSLKNWTVELKMPNFPEFPYGTYRSDCIFQRGDVRLCCWRAYVEITQKVN